jgi:hypothetical protein
MQALETPHTLAPGELGASMELAAHGAAFGPDISVYGARVRGGITEAVEASGELQVGHLFVEDDRVDTHPNVYGLRVGAKLLPFRHLALAAGLGAGASAAGIYASPDLGAIIAFENPYLVPFAAARGFVSLPISAESVLLGYDDEEDTDQPITDSPKLTVGASLSGGLRVPLRRPGEERGSFLFGVSFTTMADADDDMSLSGVATGLEVVF